MLELTAPEDSAEAHLKSRVNSTTVVPQVRRTLEFASYVLTIEILVSLFNNAEHTNISDSQINAHIHVQGNTGV